MRRAQRTGEDLETNSMPNSNETYAICDTGPLVSAFQSDGIALMVEIFDQILITSVCRTEFCNRAKGNDIGSIVPATGEFVRFFNPRSDSWSEHSALREEMRIAPLTGIGIATERILAFNDGQRLLERQTLYEEGRYPTVSAQAQIRDDN